MSNSVFAQGKYYFSFCKNNNEKQGDFIWQEVWRTSIHLFEVHWNDHLVNYFSLMHRCWSQCKFIAFNIFSSRILITSGKILIITVISNNKPNELTIYVNYFQTSQYFTNKSQLLYFKWRKNLRACGNCK